MATKINMPHEGGLHFLYTFFGTQAKTLTADGDEPFTIMFYKTDSATPLTFNDLDMQGTKTFAVDASSGVLTLTTRDEGDPTNPVALVDLTDPTASCPLHVSSTPSGMEYSRLTLNKAIDLINGVPQVEFPEVNAIFTGDFGYIHGYAITDSATDIVIFRQLFDTPFNTNPEGSATSTTLNFIPTLKFGNTTSKLT